MNTLLSMTYFIELTNNIIVLLTALAQQSVHQRQADTAAPALSLLEQA